LLALVVLVFLVSIAGVAFWLTDSAPLARDQVFRDKPESEWIKGIKYNDEDQEKEWQSYGEEGAHVLIRGLKRAQRPGERAYRQLNRKLPATVRRFLPAPKMDSTRITRHCLVALIAGLGTNANVATDVMIDVVVDDEDPGVRQSAINFFTDSEDEKSRVNRLPPAQKTRLLPGLISALQNPSNWGLRNNAALALKFYPEHRLTVAPVLQNALQDPQPQVRLLAAEALNRVAPDIARESKTTLILADIAKNPDDQIAHRAVAALGRPGADPAVAVPALIESLRNTNSLVACQAAWSLEWAPKEFQPHSEIIVRALTSAAERNDNPGRYAKVALKRWTSRSAQTESKTH